MGCRRACAFITFKVLLNNTDFNFFFLFFCVFFLLCFANFFKRFLCRNKSVAFFIRFAFHYIWKMKMKTENGKWWKIKQTHRCGSYFVGRNPKYVVWTAIPHEVFVIHKHNCFFYFYFVCSFLFLIHFRWIQLKFSSSDKYISLF